MEIKPPTININDYDINYVHEKGAIMAISNRKLHTEIKFQATSIMEKEGFVAGSCIEIWTQLRAEEGLNIIHLHLNDTSDEVTLSVDELKVG